MHLHPGVNFRGFLKKKFEISRAVCVMVRVKLVKTRIGPQVA
jgi:hypothetical protein